MKLVIGLFLLCLAPVAAFGSAQAFANYHHEPEAQEMAWILLTATIFLLIISSIFFLKAYRNNKFRDKS